MLTDDEKKRYTRQILLEEIGEPGQEKLKAARILVAGAGGIGSAVLNCLAAAGIGRIHIVDCDTVEMSNLNRQILHWQKDIGRKKTDSAAEKLQAINPDIDVVVMHATISKDNILDLASGVNGIVDAMDNMPARYILNEAAVKMRIPFFHGAVYGFEGRAMTVLPGKTACLRCLYRGPVEREIFPVLGTAPAMIGAVQACEVIKYLVGAGRLLTDRMLTIDGLTMNASEFKIHRNPNCEHCASPG